MENQFSENKASEEQKAFEEQSDKLIDEINELLKKKPLRVVKLAIVNTLINFALICGGKHPILSQIILMQIMEEACNILTEVMKNDDGN